MAEPKTVKDCWGMANRALEPKSAAIWALVAAVLSVRDELRASRTGIEPENWIDDG